jgi:NAD(P)-dependent dehydrogenase (short-subunit alcohol dehydrogenase family)
MDESYSREPVSAKANTSRSRPDNCSEAKRMIEDMSNQTALVTGGATGIGKAIAQALVERNASVAIGDLNLEAARATAKSLGKSAIALELDVGKNKPVAAAFAAIVEKWGKLDILINNAGVVTATPGREGFAPDRDIDWSAVWNVNLRGTVRCSAAAIKLMKKERYGKIVSIASMAGHAARGTAGAYAVSKAAVLRYTKGLAMEAAPFNINVNAVCPGAVWTPLQERAATRRRRIEPERFSQEKELYDVFSATFSPITPLGRPQTPEDVANAVLFLASEASRNITAQCLHVDGGIILRD